VASQTVTVKAGKGRILSHWAEPQAGRPTLKRRHGSVVYTISAEDGRNLEEVAFGVHFEHLAPFATFRRVVREVSLSHWGPAAVEDHYELANDAAPLRVGFSRADMQMRRWGGASVRRLTAALPAEATQVRFRDVLGNISSSNLRAGEHGLELVTNQRFPLLGGWRSAFHHTYSLPPGALIARNTTSGSFVLRMGAHAPCREPVVDSLELRLVLPEGAVVRSVSTSPIMAMRRLADRRRVTLLDSPLVGRTVVVLSAADLAPQQAGDVTVVYDMPPRSWAREPLLAASACLMSLLVAWAAAAAVSRRCV